MTSFLYSIRQQWDGRSTGHDPIELTLTPHSAGLDLEVTAPFFNDPENPGGEQGEAFPQLWDYEVVEAFFLSDDGRYLEIELSPHGQHLVLLLNGCRNMLKDRLPLQYEQSINGSVWKGKASIPAAYLPAGVTKFNAYAIHGSGDKRMYEALYPAEQGKHQQPDFHRLEYFGTAEFSKDLPQSWSPEARKLWNLDELNK